MRKIEKKGRGQTSLMLGLLALVIILMISLRYCSRPPGGAEKIRQPSGGDTVDVAISYSPMTLYRYADTLGGFSYDMLRLIAATGNFEFKFHPVTSMEQALEGLGTGLYDLLVADIAKTAGLDSSFEYTEDVYLDKQVLVQPKDSAGLMAVSSQLDLGGKEVWVEAASPALTRLKHLSEEMGDTIMVRTDNQYNSEQLFIMTALGEIPMAVVNELVARKLAPDYPSVDISTGISFTQFQSWITRASDRRLLDSLNTAISRFKSTGQYETLVNRYK